MVKNSGKRTGEGSETEGNLKDDVDALFRLPLAEFTGARQTLAARLKKAGRGAEADRVKALSKPPISAWTVNQLYWKHRESFDRLIATGERFRKAQASRVAGKIADMREALDARREALSDLSRLATTLLHDAGHNPSPDMLRRVTTTLEALSAYASLPDAPPAGRLTHDVDPPGFESLASWIPSASITERTEESAQRTPLQKSVSVTRRTGRKAAPVSNVRQLEETRRANIADAKASLRNAKRVLNQAQATAQRAKEAQKKAEADAKNAEKQRRKAEQKLEKARAVAEDAARRARSVATEVEDAAKAIEVAERTVEKTSQEFESLLREFSAE